MPGFHPLTPTFCLSLIYHHLMTNNTYFLLYSQCFWSPPPTPPPKMSAPLLTHLEIMETPFLFEVFYSADIHELHGAAVWFGTGKAGAHLARFCFVFQNAAFRVLSASWTKELSCWARLKAAVCRTSWKLFHHEANLGRPGKLHMDCSLSLQEASSSFSSLSLPAI